MDIVYALLMAIGLLVAGAAFEVAWEDRRTRHADREVRRG